MSKSLRQVFSSAWNTTKNNFKTLLVGILIYSIPTLLFSLTSYVLAQYPRIAVYMGGMISIFAFLYVVFALPLFMGYIVSVLRSFHLTGAPATFLNAWKAAKANYLRYLTTLLASIAITFVAVLLIMIVYVIVAAVALGFSVGMTLNVNEAKIVWSLLPAAVIFAVLLMLYLLCISFVQFIPGMEATSGFGAVFKSFKYMVRGNFWKSLGHILLLEIIIGSIQAVVMIPWIVSYLSMLSDVSAIGMPLAISSFLYGMPIITAISMIVGALLKTFAMPYIFEVYLNAKSVNDKKDSQGVMTTVNFESYVQPNAQPQNWQPQSSQQIPLAPQAEPTQPPQPTEGEDQDSQ